MNVSLLRDNKLLHGQERRGSRMSVRMPSRQPSMASLRPHSPNASIGKTGMKYHLNSRICTIRCYSMFNLYIFCVSFYFLINLILNFSKFPFSIALFQDFSVDFNFPCSYIIMVYDV